MSEVIEHIEAVVEKTQEEIIAEAVEAEVQAQLESRLEARLKEERDKIARGMLNEGRQRERNDFTKLFQKHGVELGDNPEAAIATIFENMKQLEAREVDAETLAQLDASFAEREAAVKQRDEAIATHSAYVVQSALTNALAGRAVDASSALKYLVLEYTFELGAGGEIGIIGRNGETLLTDTHEPASVEWVVKHFLERHPYLAKAHERRTDTQHEDVTAGGVEFLRKLRGEWSESELQRALDMVASGTIVNKGGEVGGEVMQFALVNYVNSNTFTQVLRLNEWFGSDV